LVLVLRYGKVEDGYLVFSAPQGAQQTALA